MVNPATNLVIQNTAVGLPSTDGRHGSLYAGCPRNTQNHQLKPFQPTSLFVASGIFSLLRSINNCHNPNKRKISHIRCYTASAHPLFITPTSLPALRSPHFALRTFLAESALFARTPAVEESDALFDVSMLERDASRDVKYLCWQKTKTTNDHRISLVYFSSRTYICFLGCTSPSLSWDLYIKALTVEGSLSGHSPSEAYYEGADSCSPSQDSQPLLQRTCFRDET